MATEANPEALMPYGVELIAPRTVAIADSPAAPLRPSTVRVRTLYSGLSAGTELATYRGTSPHLTKRWDRATRLFAPGGTTFSYPVTVWGYSEVGRVVECGDQVDHLRPGDLVWGIWGHRSEAVVEAEPLRGHVLPTGTDALDGIFARVGAVALNALFAAEPRLGESIAIFGQGVIGLLCGQLARVSGASVYAVDLQPSRLRRAEAFGAVAVAADEPVGAGRLLRSHTAGAGVDVAVELSGSYRALHEAVRAVTVDGLVVAAGFYQGEASGLALGEEFHHNRVRIVASQIGGVPTSLAPRWTPARLHATFVDLVCAKLVEVSSLVTHVVPAGQAQSAFELIDRGGPDVLQVVLDFEADDPR